MFAKMFMTICLAVCMMKCANFKQITRKPYLEKQSNTKIAEKQLKV